MRALARLTARRIGGWTWLWAEDEEIDFDTLGDYVDYLGQYHILVNN